MYTKRKELPYPLHIQVNRSGCVPEITIEVKSKDSEHKDIIKRELRETARKICRLTKKKVRYSVEML